MNRTAHFLTAGSLVFGTVFFVFSCRSAAQSPDATTVPPAITSGPEAAIASAERVSGAFREAANRVLPATLKVIAHLRTEDERKAAQADGMSILAAQGEGRFPGDNTGTGFIVDSRGVILTNRHILKGKEFYVELADGRRFKVLRHCFDEETDLAALWIKPPERLPSARLGDSDAVEVGDWVLAIGNPYELDQTVSVGIISATGRSVRTVSRGDFLQTDASINPGNSGGPLVNIRGEVVGVNTLVASFQDAESRTGQGIGFAISSNNALWVLRQLVEKGRVDRAWLGVVPRPVSAAIAERLGATPRVGLFVEQVVEQSPAQKAGIRADDILLAFDDQPLNTVAEFQRLEERAALDGDHSVRLIRRGQEMIVKTAVVPLPESYTKRAREAAAGQVKGFRDRFLGLILIEPNDEQIRRLPFKGRKGILVADTYPDSRAEKAGFKRGMLIVEIDGIPVPNKDAFLRQQDEGKLMSGIAFEILDPKGASQKITVKAVP